MTRDQAMRCAKREPGRSWEAISSEIRKIGTGLPILFLTCLHAGCISFLITQQLCCHGNRMQIISIERLR